MKTLLEEIVKPLARRIGATMSGILIGIGATTELASQVDIAVTALVLFGSDLLFSWAARRQRESK